MPFDRRAIPVDAVESRWTARDGQSIRRIDLPAAADRAKGSLQFLGGRADFYEKYLESLAHWQAQGWRTTAIDWRGQGDSGRLGADAVTGHIGDFADWVADLAEFWRAWSADAPGPRVLAGHSMGGHLALRAATEGQIAPDALVLLAPMLGLHSPLPPAAMHAVARAMAAIGDRRRPAWKWSEKPGEPPASRARLLTHDAERYEDELWWRRERPAVVMGPGSWGWVERGYASMRGLAAPGALEGMSVPTLILATTADRLVAYPPIAAAAARLPNAELVTFGSEASHEILREADPVRHRAWSAIDAFLARTADGQ